MERENETNEEVMKQFFEGHFFSGPTGLSDIGTNDNHRGGEEGTVANELVNLLHDWMEVPSVIANLLHPENGGGGTVKLSTSMGRLNSIQEDEETTMESFSHKKESGGGGGSLGDVEDDEAYKHHAKAIQLARHCNNTWPLLARSVAPSANQRQATPLEYATGSNTPRGLIPNSPLASPKKSRTTAANQQVQTAFSGSSPKNDRVSALTGALKNQLELNPAVSSKSTVTDSTTATKILSYSFTARSHRSRRTVSRNVLLGHILGRARFTRKRHVLDSDGRHSKFALYG